MAAQEKLLNWARQLNSEAPFFRVYIRCAACRNLAANKTAQAIPFLVSALANSDGQIRRLAENGLRSLNTPETIEALFLGYVFTREEILRQILKAFGRDVTEVVKPPGHLPSEPVSALSQVEQVWRFRNNQDGTVLAFVPEGDFLAGEEGFRVHLPPYYLALTCVTNAQYAQFLTERRPNPAKLRTWVNLDQSAAIHKEDDTYKADPEKVKLPVVWVAWEGAAAYCKWAGLRLPSELEWEKGARGVDGRLYPWGNEWEEGRPNPGAGEQKPEEITNVWAYPTARSPYGLYQMVGDVYEWCADWYEESAYQRYSQGNLKPPHHGEHKVLRGGTWRFGTPAYLKTEYRKSTVWRAGTMLCGFRCAKSP